MTRSNKNNREIYKTHAKEFSRISLEKSFVRLNLNEDFLCDKVEELKIEIEKLKSFDKLTKLAKVFKVKPKEMLDLFKIMKLK